MRLPLLKITFYISILALAACATQQPVIYPNAHYQQVGDAQLKQDVQMCMDQARAAGASDGNKAGEVASTTAKSGAIGAASGAVGGAITGSAGTGAAVGAASAATGGLLHSLFSDQKASLAFKRYVSRCLQDRGYEVSGWD